MKFCAKSFAAGVIVAVVGVSTVFATSAIKSAQFNSNKVVFDGEAIDMTANPMLSVVKEGETAFSNYMPLRAVLEAMGFEVDWDGAASTVIINSKVTQTAPAAAEAPAPDVSEKLVGYWIMADADGTVLKYHFAEDGHFEAYIETVAEGQADKSTRGGTYEVEGNVITLKFDDRSTEEAGFEIEFAEDGNSWATVIEAQNATLVFEADSDTSWTE